MADLLTFDALLEAWGATRKPDPASIEPLIVRALDSIQEGEYKLLFPGRDSMVFRYEHRRRVINGKPIYPDKATAEEHGGTYWDYSIAMTVVIRGQYWIWLSDEEAGGCECMSSATGAGVERVLIDGRWYRLCKHVAALMIQANGTAEWEVIEATRKQDAINEAEREARELAEKKAARRKEIAAENEAKRQRKAAKLEAARAKAV